MINMLLNKLLMHGYGSYVWSAVFFSIACLSGVSIYVHFLCKNTLMRIKLGSESTND